MSRSYFKPGDWNAICDQCGAKFKASELLLQWDNARVCRSCWDYRNPQELQLPQPIPSTPAWIRADVAIFEEISTTRVVDGALLNSQSMG